MKVKLCLCVIKQHTMKTNLTVEMLDGSQNRSEVYGETYLLHLPGIESQFLRSESSAIVTIVTEPCQSIN
jgi:hypothetical protein